MQRTVYASPSSSSSRARRGQLPPLAPRHAPASTRGDRSDNNTGRPPRLSHRSRAGCWTCRGRKVKCDEVHPTCGQCLRLNRECDWDHRWNFSDATLNTQAKYANVITLGNAVWDPRARLSPNRSPATALDDLPAFSVLQTDDERERKAETQRPGTFGVVVTPESFMDLPEYAATVDPQGRRASIQSQSSLGGFPSLSRSVSRVRTQPDPNTVVLDRFEDVSPASASPFGVSPSTRRPSLPESMWQLALTTPSPSTTGRRPTAPFTPATRSEHSGVTRFRHYILRILVQPEEDNTSSNTIVQGSTRDTFEVKALQFPPLHHAICAISALNMAYGARSTLEEAIQHYHSALSAGATPDDLLADGVFLRHFLLFIYDLCMPMTDDNNMWADHLNHLKQIALQRKQRLGREPHAFIIWSVCELDTYACLMGSGDCEFVRFVLHNNILPPLEQQIPVVNLSAPYRPEEAAIFPAILAVRQNMLVYTAKLAQLAQACRREAAGPEAQSADTHAKWQAAIAHAQGELNTSWTEAYPDFLPQDPVQAGRNLPSRVRFVFEHAYLLYHAAMIYSRTSMFPRQRRILANPPDVHTDTERRVLAIIALASESVEAGLLERRHVVFPLFIAGYATLQPDAKVKALDLISAFETTGIGQNTARTRRLLKLVYEQQRQMYDAGGRMEDVDWLAVAREKRLTVVNCGL